jgi:DNA-binding response OmpR family regulator
VRPKILVVDDEPEAAELVEYNLKQAGFEVSIAHRRGWDRGR